jgi:rod shape-determining protein MreD
MRWRQMFLALALIIPAVAFELSVLSRLGLPGATPDLVAVLVGAVAVVCGSGVGAIAGFTGGLLLDLVPPADGIVGIWAAVFTIVGYLIGSRDSLLLRGRVVATLEVAVGGLAAVVGRVLLGGVLGDPRVVWQSLPLLLVTEFLYCLVLVALVLPVVGFLARRLAQPGEARSA